MGSCSLACCHTKNLTKVMAAGRRGWGWRGWRGGGGLMEGGVGWQQLCCATVSESDVCLCMQNACGVACHTCSWVEAELAALWRLVLIIGRASLHRKQPDWLLFIYLPSKLCFWGLKKVMVMLFIEQIVSQLFFSELVKQVHKWIWSSALILSYFLNSFNHKW